MTSPLEAYLRDNPQLRSRDRGELLNELYQTSGVEQPIEEFQQKLLTDPDDPGFRKQFAGSIPHKPGQFTEKVVPFAKGVVRGAVDSAAGILETGENIAKEMKIPEGNPLDIQVPEQYRDPGRFAKWLRDKPPTIDAQQKIPGGAGFFVGAAPGEVFQFVRGKWLWAAARGMEWAEKSAEQQGPNRKTTGLDVPDFARDASEFVGISLPQTFGESWAKAITPSSWHEIPPGGGATPWEKLRNASAGAVANAYILWTAKVFSPQQWMQQSWRTGMALGEQDLVQGKGYDEGLFNFGMSFIIGAAAGKFSANAQKAYDEAIAAAQRGDGKGAMRYMDELLKDKDVAQAVANAARTRAPETVAAEGGMSPRQVAANQAFAEAEKEINSLELQRAQIGRQLLSEKLPAETKAQLEKQSQVIEDQYNAALEKAHDLSWEQHAPKHNEYRPGGPMPPVAYTDRLSRWTAMERSEASLSEAIGNMQMRNAQRMKFMEESEVLFKGVPGAEREAMMTAFMRGEVDKIPLAYRPWFDEAAKINQELYAGERSSEINYEYRENYFHLQWREAQQGKAKAYAAARPRFSKEKIFEDVAEGRAAGFELKSTNPAVLLAARIEASNLSRARVDSMHWMVEDGLAVPRELMPGADLKAGANSGPNWRPERPEVFEGWLKREVGGKEYFVHPDAWKYYERAFSMDKIPLSNFFNIMEGGGAERTLKSLGDAWMTMRNAMIPLKLSLSGFHAHHMVGIWTVANRVPIITALANKKATYADFIKAAQDTDRLGSYAAGARLRENFTKPYHELSPIEQTEKDALVLMGMNPAQPDIYRLRAQRAFQRTLNDELPRYYDMWKDEGFANKAAAAWGMSVQNAKAVGIGIGRMIEHMQAPLFNDWIPAVKTNAALQEFKTMVSTRPELLANTPQAKAQLRVEATKIRKNIDDRFGEMQYEKAFWPSWLKRGLQGSMLSVGWNFSGARMFIGGMQDLLRVEQRGGSFRGLGNWGKGEPRPASGIFKDEESSVMKAPQYGDISTRMVFGGMYVGYAMLQNALLTMINTGRVEGIKDGFYPKDTQGGRLNTPFQTRLFGEIYYHTRNEGIVQGLEKMGYSKLNSPAQAIWELLENKNYFNNDVYDPLGTPTEQLVQGLKHFSMTAMAPISWQSTVGRGINDPRQWGLSVGGYSPAPSYSEYTPFEARVNDLFEHYKPGFVTSKAFDEEDKNELGRELAKAFKKAHTSRNQADWDRYDELNRQYEEAFPWRLNKGQVRTMREKRWAGPRLAFKWSQLTEKQQDKLLEDVLKQDGGKAIADAYGPWSHPIVREKYHYATPPRYVRQPTVKNKAEEPSEFKELLKALGAKPSASAGPKSPLRVGPPQAGSAEEKKVRERIKAITDEIESGRPPPSNEQPQINVAPPPKLEFNFDDRRYR